MTGLNIWAIIVCGVLSMIIGSIWYGPLFGKMWMKICGVTEMDEQKRKEMQKKALPQYIIQFILVLFQLYVFAHLAGPTPWIAVQSGLWIWAAFIMPMIASCAMWTNDSRKVMWSRFLIQAGYQLVLFVVFGLVIGGWH
jgi:hypothetical protein